MFESKPTLKPSKQICRSSQLLPLLSALTTRPFTIVTKRHNLAVCCPSKRFAVAIQARPNGQGGDDSIQQYWLNNQLESKLAVIGGF